MKKKVIADAYNHSSMGTEVEVIVAGVTNLAVNDSPCKQKSSSQPGTMKKLFLLFQCIKSKSK